MNIEIRTSDRTKIKAADNQISTTQSYAMDYKILILCGVPSDNQDSLLALLASQNIPHKIQRDMTKSEMVNMCGADWKY